ncbi:GNAT family N-acetyltransferase [Pseudomonas coronafaciens]|uniref:GNAT family N-acetyltransferase n=1 Tax=Pseudomonas coronafaciens TaxID=53409 RepID=UPI000F00F44C|nr:GNAT family N-acetyltransferase [Pseudomonas coronafaciens]RMV70045.1 GCN5-related N-acetyltransferase [Pseudomonas coronafaciens pv. atropurpurea]
MTNQTRNAGVTYRRMTEDDLPSAHELSQAVYWAHRLEDWQLMHRLGTGFVAQENGTLAGTGLCWKFGNTHASLGMIIVSSERQGKGIGRELMNLVLEELGERCILLTATPVGQPLYEKLGFVPTGTVDHHQGMMQQPSPLALAAGERIRPVAAGDLQALAALATRALGMPREEFMAQVLNVAEGVLIEKNGEAIGFSIMRPFGLGRVIGPVVAPDTQRAKALIAHWARTYSGSFVRVDVTGESGLGTWVESLGLALAGPSVRMVRGQAPVSDDTVKQYAIFSQALG